MMERRQITVDVHEWDEDFNVPLSDLIAQLVGLAKLVPDGHVAMINFDRSGNDYDYSLGHMSVYYVRQETDKELRTRKQHDDRRVTDQEAWERAELARLQSKYR